MCELIKGSIHVSFQPSRGQVSHQDLPSQCQQVRKKNFIVNRYIPILKRIIFKIYECVLTGVIPTGCYILILSEINPFTLKIN